MTNTSTPKWLVTGGAGFLGINLVRYLLQRGCTVSTLDIAPFEYADCRDKITHYQADIRNPEALHAAMDGVQIVVHAAAALPLYSPDDIRTTDIDGTANILSAAKGHGVTRFVHISSTAVYGVPDHHPIVEEDKLVGVGAYGIAKIEAERLCEGYRSQTFAVTILRPKSFIGAERLGVFGLLYDWAADGHSFPVLGNGSNRYQLLDVEDLCAAIYGVSQAPTDAANDTYNIGAEVFSTFREDLQVVLDAAGFHKRVIGIPAAPIIALLRVLEALKLSPLYAWVYETAAKDSFVAIQKAKDAFGYAPRFSNREALLRNFHWYLENRETFAHSGTGVSHRVPWKQGILGIAKRFF